MFDHSGVTAALDLKRCPCAHAGNSRKTITGHPCGCRGGAGADPIEYECYDGSTDDIQFDDTDGAYLVGDPDAVVDPVHDRLTLAAGRRVKITGTMPAPAPASEPTGSASWAVLPTLRQVLPDGLRRGSTMAVTSSVSLLLALLGTPSTAGAWAAMIGMPMISADALGEAGVDLSHLAIINPTEGVRWTGPSWTTAVGALLDAVDVVVARPPAATGAGLRSGAVSDPDARRLTARARSKGAVLILFGQHGASWPSVRTQLSARHAQWSGIGDGHGRITARQLTVSATGRGLSARPRTTQLWLPAAADPIRAGGSGAESTASAKSAAMSTASAESTGADVRTLPQAG